MKLWKRGPSAQDNELDALKRKLKELEASNARLKQVADAQRFEMDTLHSFVRDNTTEAARKTASGYRVEIGCNGCRSCEHRLRVFNCYGWDRDARCRYRSICNKHNHRIDARNGTCNEKGSKHDHRVDGRNGICNYKEKQKCPSE